MRKSYFEAFHGNLVSQNFRTIQYSETAGHLCDTLLKIVESI